VAEEAFDQHQVTGSGLDVIFLKLGNMEKQIKDEQGNEKVRMAAYNGKCTKEMKAQSDIISLSTATRQNLKGYTATSNQIVRSCPYLTHYHG
jgi:hypothetical protein